MTTPIKPPRLRPNDAVGIVSLSSPTAARVPKRLERGLGQIRSLGFRVIPGRSLTVFSGHTAGSVEERADDFNRMIRDPSVRAIFTTVGGYSTHQILEFVDYDALKRDPKVIVGYSDTTTLLLAILQEVNLVVFYGPAILPQFGEFGQPFAETVHWLLAAITRTDPIGELRASSDFTDEKLMWDEQDARPRQTRCNPGLQVFRAGTSRGRILAGNAGAMLLLAGTHWFPDFDEKMVFLEEDEEETPATVDRHITQLKHTGVFQRVTGLVWGRFPSSIGFSSEDSFEQILGRGIAGCPPFPVVLHADFGHTDPIWTLPVGIECELTTVPGPSLKVLESAVSD